MRKTALSTQPYFLNAQLIVTFLKKTAAWKALLVNSSRQEATKKLVTQRIKWAIILLLKMLFAMGV